MTDSILKNPIIYGLFATVLTYAYLSWKKKKEISKAKLKKSKITPNPHVDIILPFVIGIIVWLIAFGYFTHNEQKVEQPMIPKSFMPMMHGGGDVFNKIPMHQMQQVNPMQPTQQMQQLQQMQQVQPMQQVNPMNHMQMGGNIPQYKLVNQVSESPKSFTLLNRNNGIVMPTNLPEMMIDSFKF